MTEYVYDPGLQKHVTAWSNNRTSAVTAWCKNLLKVGGVINEHLIELAEFPKNCDMLPYPWYNNLNLIFLSTIIFSEIGNDIFSSKFWCRTYENLTFVENFNTNTRFLKIPHYQTALYA